MSGQATPPSSARFALPRKDELRIWQLLPLLCAYLGWPQGGGEESRLAGLERVVAANRQLLALSGRPRRLCLVVVDGMGEELLQARRGHLAFMRRFLASAREEIGGIYTTVPSTTASALASLHTATPSEENGMLGYECVDPSTRRNVNLLRFDGWEPEQIKRWCATENFYAALVSSGLSVRGVLPERFRGSGLTRIIIPDDAFVAAQSVEQRIEQAVKLARQGTDLIYFYWPELDHVGHNHGWQSELWTRELERVDSALRELRSRLPADVLMAVCADHGMVDTSAARTVDLARAAEFADLREEIEIVSGEPRCLHLHARADFSLSRWQEAFGARAWVVDPARGPWGEKLLTGSHLARLGEAVVFACSNWQFYDSRFQPEKITRMVGVHGSLSTAEMRVPLLLL